MFFISFVFYYNIDTSYLKAVHGSTCCKPLMNVLVIKFFTVHFQKCTS